MLRSMTGFARVEDEGFVWELRSVNLRGLDLRFRLPDSLSDMEPKLREIGSQKLSRGRVESSLRLDSSVVTAREIEEEQLKWLETMTRKLRPHFGDMPLPQPLDVLRWPGVLSTQKTPDDSDRDAVRSAFQRAVEELIASRQREGSALEHTFKERLDSIEKIVRSMDDHRESQVEMIRQRMLKKVARFDATVDNARLEQEVALLAQRADFDEERDRLLSHVEDMRSCFDADDAQGSRIVFLVQEMSREASTLAAKAVVPECSTMAVDMRVLIDQIREQDQNVE